MSDEHKGIYKKYRVERLNDPVGKHSDCTYFVLDLVHDEFSFAALKAYAEACKKKFPQLAKDIKWALRTTTKSTAFRWKMEHEG